MDLNTNFVDINNIKSSPVKDYEKLNTSKLENEASSLFNSIFCNISVTSLLLTLFIF